MVMATWRQMLEYAVSATKDSIDKLTFEPADIDLDREFDDGFGSEEGVPFRAYSRKWIYFVTEYDGAEYVRYMPRNPGSGVTPYHF
jgi:hypothetical protein